MPVPFFGISFVISMLVIAVSFIIEMINIRLPAYAHNKTSSKIRERQILKTGISVIIVLSIFLICFATYFFILKTALEGRHNNFTIAEQLIVGCEKIEVKTNDRMIILRLDDVQAFAWNDLTIKMMNDAILHDMPIVAGVIPETLATDPVITSFLKRNLCNIEIALHGYTHGSNTDYDDTVVGEFQNIDATTAREKIHAGLTALAPITKKGIVTFIPPQNEISDEAQSVLSEFGITHLSSEGVGTFDYDAKTWNDTTAVDIITQCETRYAEGDSLCVIMLHPQEFSTDDMKIDEERYAEYTKLLNLISHLGITVVRFNDVPRAD